MSADDDGRDAAGGEPVRDHAGGFRLSGNRWPFGRMRGEQELPGVGLVAFEGRRLGRRPTITFRPEGEGVDEYVLPNDPGLLLGLIKCSTPGEALELIRNPSASPRYVEFDSGEVEPGDVSYRSPEGFSMAGGAGPFGRVRGHADLPGIGRLRYHGRKGGERIKGVFRPAIEGAEEVRFTGDMRIVHEVLEASTPSEALEAVRRRSR